MPALQIDSSRLERLRDDLQRLGESLGPFSERAPFQARPAVFVLDRPAADTELEPARRDVVECRGHLGEQGGVPELVAQHHVSHPQPLGTREQRGRQRPCLQ